MSLVLSQEGRSPCEPRLLKGGLCKPFADFSVGLQKNKCKKNSTPGKKKMGNKSEISLLFYQVALSGAQGETSSKIRSLCESTGETPRKFITFGD